MKAIISVLFVLLLGMPGATTRESRPSAESKDLGLFSWQPKDKQWHFVLLPDPGDRFSDKKIMKSKGVLVGTAALKARLAALPRDTTIVWRDGPPAHVLTYPSDALKNEIIEFAKHHGINIFVVPTIGEAG